MVDADLPERCRPVAERFVSAGRVVPGLSVEGREGPAVVVVAAALGRRPCAHGGLLAARRRREPVGRADARSRSGSTRRMRARLLRGRGASPCTRRGRRSVDRGLARRADQRRPVAAGIGTDARGAAPGRRRPGVGPPGSPAAGRPGCACGSTSPRSRGRRRGAWSCAAGRRRAEPDRPGERRSGAATPCPGRARSRRELLAGLGHAVRLAPELAPLLDEARPAGGARRRGARPSPSGPPAGRRRHRRAAADVVDRRGRRPAGPGVDPEADPSGVGGDAGGVGLDAMVDFQLGGGHRRGGADGQRTSRRWRPPRRPSAPRAGAGPMGGGPPRRAAAVLAARAARAGQRRRAAARRAWGSTTWMRRTVPTSSASWPPAGSATCSTTRCTPR